MFIRKAFLGFERTAQQSLATRQALTRSSGNGSRSGFGR